MELSQWLCALCIFSTLIILRISSSLKFKEFSLDLLKTFGLLEVCCCCFKVFKNVCLRLDISYKMILYQNRWNYWDFFHCKRVLRIDQYVFACSSGLFSFFTRFSWYKFLVEEINSLISVIKVSRNTKSLSNLPFWMYCLKSRFFVLILDFMISFIHTGSLLSIVIYLLGTYFRKTFKIVPFSAVTCALIFLVSKSLSKFTESRGFLIIFTSSYL